MSTATSDVIEGVDLDANPSCQSRHGCGADATWVWIQADGCRPMVCDLHMRMHAYQLAQLEFPNMTRPCPHCGSRWLVACISDIGRWVAL